VSCLITEGYEVILESTGEHVEPDSAAMYEVQRGNHLCSCERMHVEWLDGYERAALADSLQHRLRYRPSIHNPVIGVYQHAPATSDLAPGGNLHYT